MQEDYLNLEDSFIHAKGLSSHQGVLIKCMLASDGDVCELGSGLFSTPLLHWMCKSMGRKLITYEDHSAFYKYFSTFTSPYHKVRFVNNWDDINFKGHFGVALIDHWPGDRRYKEVLKLKDRVDYIILHDTNRKICGYDNVWEHFKYKYDWCGYRDTLSVVSNFKDLSNL